MKSIKNPSEVEKYLTTLYNLSELLPGLEDLYIEYQEGWVYAKQHDPEITEEIRKLLRRHINEWLRSSDESEIIKIITPLKMVARKKPFLLMLKELCPKKYKGFFESDFKGLPVDFAVPTPFLVMEKNSNSKLKKPIIRRYGQTKIEIRGSVLRAEDGQLTMALLLLKNKKKIDLSEKDISFDTTLEEIGKMLKKKYPKAESTRKAIWGGLTRLNDCRMTLTNAKGLRTLGGILNGAKELEEDSNLIIRIHLDRDFIDLIDEGYVSIDPVYFDLKPISANLYLYLNRQKTFNTYGTLRPVKLSTIYDQAGLSLTPENKDDNYKKFVIRKGLKDLEVKGIIKNKVQVKDMVQIIGTKTPIEPKHLTEASYKNEEEKSIIINNNPKKEKHRIQTGSLNHIGEYRLYDVELTDEDDD